MSQPGPYETDLDRNHANFVSLTPVSFLARAAHVYRDRTAVVHGDWEIGYAEFYRRVRRLASALSARGIGVGDTVAVLLPNIPAMLEAHYAVPMLGAVLNSINTRLDAATVRFILEHGGARVFLVDSDLAPIAAEALEGVAEAPLVIDVTDPLAISDQRIGELTYEAFLEEGDPAFPWAPPADEWQACCLNYTSGTTGNPKGVVYHHRGAYLNAMGNAIAMGLNADSRYLWTLPMFHCNGWTFTWGVTAVGGTHICLRRVEPGPIFESIVRNRVTHMCGAPIVLSMLIHAPDEAKRLFDWTVDMATGGAAPPSAVIAGMEEMGFRVTHLYGLTECYGPSLICLPQPDWQEKPLAERAPLMARQGVAYATIEDIQIADPETGEPVPKDGETIGELMLRGNTLMKGYLKNRSASDSAFKGGWFRTGDLGVRHADGYVEIKDRSKDIIISGGENISSLEVEEVLYKHPKIMEAAVVARPDQKWGETPCAFVTPKPGAGDLTADSVISWCREHMAHYKVPKTVVFGALPKTSTGKIQKFVLRQQAAELS